MGSFQIEGGHRLKGNITPQGAKNEALQILCAVLLTEETVTISNLPDIVDVNKLIGLLQKMGVKVAQLGSPRRFTDLSPAPLVMVRGAWVMIKPDFQCLAASQ